MKQTLSRVQPRSRVVTASLTLALLAAVQSASAATQYWDPSLTPTANSGKGSGGSGIWTTSNATWSNNTTDAVLTAANIAGFAGAGGTVTLTTPIGPTTSNGLGGLLFETSNYTIGNGTNTGQLNISAQASTDGISVASGVTGTVIDIGGIRLSSAASGTAIQLTNTDLIDFKNTTVYQSGSRTTKIANSSASATTTFAKFATSDKGAGGTWPNANLALDVGNLVINSLASASNNSSTGALSAYNGAGVVNTTFSGSTTGAITLTGNNTLFNNANAAGQLTLTVNMANGTLFLGHDNALGALNASGNATNTTIIMQKGTLAASGGARTIANAINVAGNFSVGGSNDLTLSGVVTNTNIGVTPTTGNITLNMNSANALTLSGANTYAGNTTITAGTLRLGNASALGTSNVASRYSNNTASSTAGSATTTVQSGAALDLNAQSFTGEKIVLNGTGIGSNGALLNSSATSVTLTPGINSVTITNAGSVTSGTITTPTVTPSGGGGTGFAATANVGLTGGLTTTGGTAYTTAPTVTVTGGGGSGMVITTGLSSGVVTYTLTNAGTGYTSVPTFSLTGGAGGSGASIAGGSIGIVGLTVTNFGTGYTSAPTLSISSAGWTSGATASTGYSAFTLASDSSIGGVGNINIGYAIDGTGGLTKVGANTLVLSNANTYLGNTLVSNGTLLVTNGTGSGTGSGTVTVSSGAVLGGSGIISGATTLNSATIGSSGSTLTLGSDLTTNGTSTLASGSTVNVAGSTSVATGTFTVNGNLGASGTIGGAGTVVVSSTGNITGSATINSATTVSGGTLGSSGNTLTLGSTLTTTGGSIGTGATVNVALATTFSSGTFIVDGTLGGAGTKTVSFGATLKGHGTINGNTTINGNFEPGNSPGVMTFGGDLTFTNTTVTTMELAGTGGVPGTDFDKTIVGGTLTFDGDLNIVSYSGFNIDQVGSYDLFAAGTTVGNLANVSVGATALIYNNLVNQWTAPNLASTYVYTFDVASGDLAVTAIPEPSTYAVLAGFGVLGLAAYRRRRVTLAVKRAA